MATKVSMMMMDSISCQEEISLIRRDTISTRRATMASVVTTMTMDNMLRHQASKTPMLEHSSMMISTLNMQTTMMN